MEMDVFLILISVAMKQRLAVWSTAITSHSIIVIAFFLEWGKCS
jgi:hypothetical protein